MKLSEDGRLAIKKSMPGVGMGLFAVKDIKKGDFILEYKGDRMPTKEADESESRYLFVVDDDWTINGPVPKNTAGYINHGCDPNTEAIIEEDDDGVGHIMIYATRNIESGEELTIDYGEEYFEEFIKPAGCKCENCLYANV